MNQILVTEKIYVTPELKRKKKMYRFFFVLSIFLIIAMCSVYIYAAYDREKNANIADDILSAIKNDSTVISKENNALVVLLTEDQTDNETQVVTEEIASEQNNTSDFRTATAEYVAANGMTYEYIGFVNIPKIDVNYAILSQTSDEWLKVSICKFWGCNPNEVGNFCIVGHNYRNKRFFSKVPLLEIGDIVEITDLSKRTVQYEIYDIHTVYDNNRADTTQYTNGKREVTLITCTNDSSQRIIVKCTEKI